ncbi:uncharacterized protein JN550_011506 [Neoarthrinium moseri]|uniref:uncharacterized protein n=1 Tax=Neoarthrinium moseri TaxID=1658444 RepID=UPI001FDD26F6|nr:uncharacterized protein JN550_011506 [Neoarthrinium moseri]KAI1860354.1 hypothetical protein JN550_011506 [Neoarthrinium moseri]
MANSNSNPPPPGGGTWATPHDWATYRETIAALYEGQNMTLKKIMEIMEREHNFFATYEEVNEIIRQQSSRVTATKPPASAVVVGARVRKGDGKRSRPFRRQPEAIIVHSGSSSGLSPSERTTMQRLTPSPTALSCRMPTPPNEPALSMLFPLTPPADLRYPEEAGYHIQNYFAAAFGQGMWTLEDPEWLTSNRHVVDWFNRIALARGTLSGGHTKQGFKLLQRCFDEYRDMLVTQDPRLMIYTCVAIILLVSYPEVINMLLKYIANLARIIHGPSHPLHQFWSQLQHMGLIKLLENARTLFECQVAEFGRYLAEDNPFMQSITVFSTRYLAIARLIDSDTAERQLRKLPRDGDNGRLSMALGQIQAAGGKYAEARKTILDLLDSPIDRVRTKAGAYDTLFLISRMEGKEDLVRDASAKRITFCLETFGPKNEWTIDAASDYETFLRELGDTAAADRVFSDFGIQMDKLTEGVKELEIK